ncbi:MAG: amidohydrolase family protein [Chthoniobacteraceae bacterium]
MILRARIVVPMEGPPIENGAVLVEGSQIVAVGRAGEFDGGPVHDLGEVALMPGLINAHCHLDYTMLRGAILPQRSFAGWVKRINAIKRTMEPEDCLKSIADGFEHCLNWGTTTVCTIASFPELMSRMPDPPIRTCWFYEMIDIRHRFTTEDVVAGALAFFQKRGASFARFGLSPHAPFTASLDLYRLSNDCARAFDMPLTTHVAESDEEFEMFEAARGPLHDFLASLGRPMRDCGATTPFAHLWKAGAIDSRWILAHMNRLGAGDFELLAGLAREHKPAIVHCPGTHRYFGREPFAWRRLRDLGVNLCTGTDSLASTDSLSLLSELRLLSGAEPTLSDEELLRTVTTHPARALRREAQLGKIAPGALADLIAVPVSGSVAHVHEEIVQYAGRIPWLMIDGTVKTSGIQ